MWRRFKPHSSNTSTATLSAPRTVGESSQLAEHFKRVLPRDDRAHEAARLRAQLLAQTPQAAIAQQQMDTHKHGYHNRDKRLYELIDFNDTFVALVLATRHADLPGFADQLKKDMADACQRLSTPMFSDQQYDAIVRGLAREIAVYRSAKYMGFDVHMTNRTEDAFGIDLVITQPSTQKVLNIDCKTPPSFRHRLEDLVDHGRITENDLITGDANGYLTVIQRRGSESVPVTLFCILPDRLGEIHDFSFDEPEKLRGALNTIFASVE
jgi:hypothetical protein